MLDIYKLDDEVLRENTESVKSFDSALKMLVDAMFETLTEADGVGLAAPQVGVSKKFFIVDLHEGEKGKFVFINPEIIETSIEEGPYEEGCLSIPGFYRDVIRPLRVKVQAQLFIDHLSEDERERVIKAYRKKNKKRKKD